MLASSTHDTKRSEDVRARINVLSEIPAEWYRAIRAWQLLESGQENPGHRRKRSQRERRILPLSNPAGRMAAEPDGQRRVRGLCRQRSIPIWKRRCARRRSIPAGSIRTRNTKPPFTAFSMPSSIAPSASPSSTSSRHSRRRIAQAGIFNSLSQTLLKIAAPGLPDFYQGTRSLELQSCRSRQSSAGELRSPQSCCRLAFVTPSQRIPPHSSIVWSPSPADGSLKLYVTRCGAALSPGTSRSCSPREVTCRCARGEKAQARNCFRPLLPWNHGPGAGGTILCSTRSAVRLPVGAEAWGDAEVVLRKRLPAGAYRDVFTGQDRLSDPAGWRLSSSRVSEAFAHLPIAMLVNVEGKTEGPADVE